MAVLDIGGDVFRAGGTVTHAADGADDLFMAGNRVRAEAAISGTAHLAGRRVTLTGDVGGDVYAAGETVEVTGSVTGDATLAGRAVTVGPVGGDLRIAGSDLVLGGPVGGYALVAGEELRFDAAVAGDMRLAAEDVEFGPGARVGGQLTVYEETPGTLQVPASVAPAERVERRSIEEWDGDTARFRPFSWRRAIGGFLMGVIVVAGVAALIAAVVPEHLAAMRRRVLDTPFRTLWLGFLMQSTLVGSAILFAMTVIGIVLSPAAILVALIAGFAGYVVGVYAFGAGLMLAFGRPEPDSIGDRALAAAVGALAAGLIALIPLLGWLFVLAITLAGIGAVSARVFRPVFFSPAD
jgi:hypothetical protein